MPYNTTINKIIISLYSRWFKECKFYIFDICKATMFSRDTMFFCFSRFLFLYIQFQILIWLLLPCFIFTRVRPAQYLGWSCQNLTLGLWLRSEVFMQSCRHNVASLSLFYRCFHGRCPDNLYSLFQLVQTFPAKTCIGACIRTELNQPLPFIFSC